MGWLKVPRQRAVQPNLERGDRKSFADFAGKPERQQATRVGKGQTPTAEVKDFVFVKLSNRCAMATLDIIGKDFKLGFGVHPRLFRQQKVFVRGRGVGVLGAVADKHPSVENSMRLLIKDALVKHFTGAVGNGVIDRDVSICKLLSTDDLKTIEPAFTPFIQKPGVDVLPGELSS